ncbi:hypothetical protein B0O99DRAFT_748440 [Bisporella sp. PMI_857]|nr:hypothetical protein B0O99DRAFT_748440 [Bisporella sp. PMI_857]
MSKFPTINRDSYSTEADSESIQTCSPALVRPLDEQPRHSELGQTISRNGDPSNGQRPKKPVQGFPHFNKLPIELQLMVWREAILNEEPRILELTACDLDHKPRRSLHFMITPRRQVHTPIARSCRSARKEAARFPRLRFPQHIGDSIAECEFIFRYEYDTLALYPHELMDAGASFGSVRNINKIKNILILAPKWNDSNPEESICIKADELVGLLKPCAALEVLSVAHQYEVDEDKGPIILRDILCEEEAICMQHDRLFLEQFNTLRKKVAENRKKLCYLRTRIVERAIPPNAQPSPEDGYLDDSAEADRDPSPNMSFYTDENSDVDLLPRVYNGQVVYAVPDCNYDRWLSPCIESDYPETLDLLYSCSRKDPNVATWMQNYLENIENRWENILRQEGDLNYVHSAHLLPFLPLFLLPFLLFLSVSKETELEEQGKRTNAVPQDEGEALVSIGEKATGSPTKIPHLGSGFFTAFSGRWNGWWMCSRIYLRIELQGEYLDKISASGWM